MPAGANINYSRSGSIGKRIGRILGFTPSTFDISNSAKVAYKAGPPTNNLAADEPNAKGDFLLDVTNNRVWVCTAYTNATTHTWVRIDG